MVVVARSESEGAVKVMAMALEVEVVVGPEEVMTPLPVAYDATATKRPLP